jgi:hypothetical protein
VQEHDECVAIFGWRNKNGAERTRGNRELQQATGAACNEAPDCCTRRDNKEQSYQKMVQKHPNLLFPQQS